MTKLLVSLIVLLFGFSIAQATRITRSGGGGGSGAGDVTGPASATANALARFSGTTGKIIKNSALLIDDSANVSGAATYSTTAGFLIQSLFLGNTGGGAQRLVFNNGPSGPSIDMFDNANYNGWDAMVRITTSHTAVPTLRVRAKASQTANLQEWTNDSSVVQSRVTNLGVFVPKGVTADPCGDTTGYPADSVWMNTTSHILCTCAAGADVRVSDGSTACF